MYKRILEILKKKKNDIQCNYKCINVGYKKSTAEFFNISKNEHFRQKCFIQKL